MLYLPSSNVNISPSEKSLTEKEKKQLPINIEHNFLKILQVVKHDLIMKSASSSNRISKRTEDKEDKHHLYTFKRGNVAVSVPIAPVRRSLFLRNSFIRYSLPIKTTLQR